MINVALLRVVMPGRGAISRKDYEKITISHLWIQLPEHIEKKESNHWHNTHYFYPKYITNPLSDDQIMAIKLSSNDKKTRLLDGIIYEFADIEYDIIMDLFKERDDLVNNKINKNFDYDKFIKYLGVVNTLAENQAPLSEINKKMSKSKSEIQKTIKVYNKKVNDIEKELKKYLENKKYMKSAHYF